LARRANWQAIECFDTARKVMRSPNEIAKDVLSAVEPVLGARTARSGKDGP
jgi:hypothetical protein